MGLLPYAASELFMVEVNRPDFSVSGSTGSPETGAPLTRKDKYSYELASRPPASSGFCLYHLVLLHCRSSLLSKGSRSGIPNVIPYCHLVCHRRAVSYNGLLITRRRSTDYAHVVVPTRKGVPVVFNSPSLFLLLIITKSVYWLMLKIKY